MQKRLFPAAALPCLALGSAAILLLAQPATAAPRASGSGVTALGGAGAWQAYLDQSPGGKICFLIGKPKKIDGGKVKHDEVRMSVTHRTADKATNVVNFILGYRAKKDSDAALDVGGRKFALFTDKDGAWARDAATDRAVATAMAHGKSATIKAEPEHGKPSIESYDLSGFGAALALIDKACGIKR